VVISAAILAVGLGTGLVASYMGVDLQLTIIGTEGPAELAYVPPDASLVAFANVRDVMGSPLRQKLLEVRPDGSSPITPGGEFEQKTGISIERDVEFVLASFVGNASGPDNSLVLARGTFDRIRIEGLVREQGGTLEEYAGTPILTVTEDNRTFAIAFVEPELVAVGAAANVKRAIDTKASGNSITTNAEVMSQIRDIDEGNAWAVGRFDALAQSGQLPQQVASQLPPINWFSATSHINGGVEGLVRVEATSEQAAVDLRQVIQGFLALARLQLQQNTELIAMLNTMQLGGDGNTVTLGFSIPPEMIDALAAMQRREQAAQ
jgi:hypothetical protein